MKKSSWLRILCVVLASVALGAAPGPVFAQRGGHGGGGGFHGSGGGFHGGGGRYASSGGRYYGGYRGGGYYGWRGGYRGWGGRYWGYPRYGYGWGFGVGFGWGSYWPTYPYAYGYGPWWGAPYYYPYDVPYGYPGYPYPDDGSNAPPPDPRPKSQDNSPAKPSRTFPPQSSPNRNPAPTYVADSRTTTALHTTEETTATASNYRLAHSATRPLPPPRQEVQNAIRAVGEMPPYAFQRRIDSGRYSNFTPEERQLVDSASEFPLVWENHRIGRPPGQTD
jgi:hypothetical protein